MNSADENEHDKELEDASSTALLVKAVSELQQIRWELQHLNDQLGGTGEQPQRFRCTYCDAVVPADDRRDHLSADHNAPDSVTLAASFVAVES